MLRYGRHPSVIRGQFNKHRPQLLGELGMGSKESPNPALPLGPDFSFGLAVAYGLSAEQIVSGHADFIGDGRRSVGPSTLPQ